MQVYINVGPESRPQRFRHQQMRGEGDYGNLYLNKHLQVDLMEAHLKEASQNAALRQSMLLSLF